MHVLFVEPSFPANQQRLARALAEVGARVTGIGEASADYLPGSVREALHGYEQVPSVVDEEAVNAAVERVQAREWVDRLEATVEAHILPAARVREARGIPGTSVQTAYLCRDKPAMKEFLRRNGIPCARSTRVTSAEEARRFATEVGFPLILKPPAGAGAAGTDRVGDPEGLERSLAEHGVDRGREVAVEEFIEGHEGFYDTLCIGGRVAHEFISHYYPGVLEAMRTRSVSPQLVTTNRIDAEGYGEVKELGKRVIERMGIGTSATHMEWFYGPKGLKFSEIGCRPPGVGAWDLYCAANEMDVYREWAAAIVHGDAPGTPSRRFAAGMVNLRPEGDGTIVAYDGLEVLEGGLEEWVIDSHFPPPGSATQPVEAGYMANAWVRMKHPDYDHLRAMLEAVGRSVRIRVS